MTAALDVHVVVDRPGFVLDVRLAVEAGETVAVVGPNGAGKTTLLRAIAGLERLSAGFVTLEADVVEDVSTGRHVPPERRGVGMVFQDLLLLPHLSALDNVAFGLRAQGRRRRVARAAAERWLQRLDVGSVATRRPAQLSGGQAQRVALARALATEPRALLLDEPLSALDATTRPAVRRALAEHLAAHSGPRVLVTHDPADAALLADRVIVLENGQVTQSGSHAELAARPRSSYVADLVGVNLLRGHGDGDVVRLAGGGDVVTATETSGEVLVAIHPRSVVVHRVAPEASSPRNVWQGRVLGLEPDGVGLRARVDVGVEVVAAVTAAAAGSLGLAAGVDVWLSVKASEVVVYPA